MPRKVKNVNIQFPDKQPGEGPATEKQVAFIKDLFADLDARSTELPEGLGKQQASSLIRQLIELREEYQKTPTTTAGKRGCLFWSLLIIVLLIFLNYLSGK